MPSGFSPVPTRESTSSVERSTMATSLARPSLAKPRFRSWAMAKPCTPGSESICPTTVFCCMSMTTTAVAWLTYRRWATVSSDR